MLTIKGETKMDETVKEADFHLRERRYGTFSRSVRFPVAVNAEAVEAAYEHGVLVHRAKSGSCQNADDRHSHEWKAEVIEG